ncbi:MAG TPA: hypothetical protein V6D17_11855 [Candidatus Obscuribacterales bacterium]
MPMVVAVSAGWVFVVSWLIVGIYCLTHNMYWGAILMISTLAFGGFLAFMSYSLYRDANRRFTFELTDTEAVLYTDDQVSKSQSTQIVLLDDVKYVEYYPYRDSAAIIFHAPYAQMEVPLWPLRDNGTDVIDFLEGRGVKIVNVQFDDAIPD